MPHALIKEKQVTHLIVLVIRSHLPQIPHNPTTMQHNPTETIIQSLLSSDRSNTNCPLFPNMVTHDNLLNLINPTELGSPFEDVIKEPVGEVEGYTSQMDIGSMQTHTENTFIELHELFTLFEAPEVRPPTSMMCVRMAMRSFRWVGLICGDAREANGLRLRICVISPKRTWIHWAQAGTSMFKSFSTTSK